MQLFIGLLPDVKRPEGFVIEDLRPEGTKIPHREQTYRKSPLTWGRGPLARYRRNFGDAEFNIPPLDLLADRMVEHYGEKLRGKRLVVREFSFVVLETVNRPDGVYAGGGLAGALGSAIASGIANQTMGPGHSFRLEVKIDADIDGKPFVGSDFGSLMPSSPMDVPATIASQAMDAAFYQFDQPEVAPAAEEAKPAQGPAKESN